MADRPKSPEPASPADPPIRVVVIEPHPILGLGVREVLEQNPEFDVVAHVQSATAATPYLEDAPDVVLVDVDVAEPSGDATRAMRQAAPTSAFVVIGHADDASIVEAVEIGALAHVEDSAAPHELVETIRRVAEGGDPLKEDVAGRPELVERLVDDVRESVLAATAPRLTTREMEVLAAAAAGSSNRDIAETFGLSEQTVKNHLTSIFHKLGVPNRTRAVLYGNRQGWFPLAQITSGGRRRTERTETGRTE